MNLPVGDEPGTGTNHPLAVRMGVIAFINQTVTTGSAWGSFSVLTAANETRLGVDYPHATAAVPAMLLILACAAPAAGILATRYPMRRVALFGAVCSLLGFILLTFTSTYPFYLIAYGPLLGVGAAVGAVIPSTLVARWFTSGRGRALGLANIPVVFTIMPILASYVLHGHGLTVTYGMLAALAVVTVVANLFIADPPTAARPVASLATAAGKEPAGRAAAGTLGGLLGNRRFWILAIGATASTAGSIILTASMVPMATSWGFTLKQGATLLSVYSLVAMAGSIFFGWASDRLGGTLTLALLLLCSAVLWSILLLRPPFYPLLAVMGLIGFNAVGAAPVLGFAMSEAFGQKEFSRAYGMANLVALPFTLMAVPVTAAIVKRTGSYGTAITVEIAFLLVMFLVVLAIRRPRPAALRDPLQPA